MSSPSADRRGRGFTMVEAAVSAALLSVIFYVSLSGYVGSMRGAATGTASLEAMANSARALTSMNLELQEASVRDETVEIYPIDAETGQVIPVPVDPTSVPPPGTVYPTSGSVGGNCFALRFMTIGEFTTVGDTVSVEEAGPFLYRLGDGSAGDFPRTHLLRIEQGSPDPPHVLCRGVQQLVFQRDSRGGAILITLVTQSRDPLSGQQIATRQVLTVTPKNDFSANLANFDMNGEEI